MSEPTDVGLPGGTVPAPAVPVTEIDLRDPEPTSPEPTSAGAPTEPGPAEMPEAGSPDAPAAVAPPVVDLRAAEPGAAEPGAAESGAAESGAAESEAGEGASLFDLDAFPRGAQGAVEAVLMVVDEPVAEGTLASALGLTVAQVDQVLAELVADYDEAGRGFELRRVAGGWRIYSRAEYAPVVERFMLDGQTARLTQAALETLAIVAYRQPVSRARVGAVRGVNVDAVMRTLSTRGLVEEAGSDPESGAVLYRTTPYFLQRIGLTSLDDLPALAPYLPEVDALDELGAGSAS